MPAIETNQLTKRFGAKTALDQLSIAIEPGQIFGLLGPNGAGKTTAIRLLSTALAPTSGDAKVAGFSILTQGEEVRRRIGVLNAEIGLYFRLTGRENLRYFGDLYGMPSIRINERIAELERWLDLSELLDLRAGAYSTGMKQKLAIARAVLHDPEIIILDEPTSGLDVLAAQTVLTFMKDARKKGKLVIFSTHQMDDAERLCDYVVIIHRGRLITEGTTKEILGQAKANDLTTAFLALVKKDT